MRWKEWLGETFQDVAFAFRLMRLSPAWALLVILTLALGIAANSVVFSVVDAVVLEPLPFPEPDRLVRLWEKTPEGERFSTSDPNYLDYREHNSTFTDLAALSFPFPELTLTGEGEPERFTGMACTGSLFSVIGTPPLLGRTFSPEEDAPGSKARVFVMSHGLWQRRFGSDPDIVGQTFNLNGESWTAIGVMPEDFEFMLPRDVWVPFAADPNYSRGDHRREMFGRLAPGVSLEQAQADMTTIARRLGQEYPESNEGWGVELASFPEWIIGRPVRQAALVLQIAVGLMLLLACANASNLLIAQATTRQREIGLRAALGAGRFRIVRQLLAESVLFSVLGAIAGILLAYWAIPLVRVWNPDALPRIDEVSLNTSVLVFTILVSLAAGVLSGLAPALQVTRGNLFDSLREGHQESSGSGRRLRDILVTGEVAVAVMLLICAGLLINSFRQLTDVDIGFDPTNVVTASFTLPENRYTEMSPETAAFYQNVRANIEAIPGVRSAGATMVDPFRGPNPSNEVAPVGINDVDDFVPIRWRTVTLGYFKTLGIPLIQGRVFEERDRLDPTTADDREFVAVISASLARKLWPNQNPIGERLQWNRPGALVVEVIGVVGDIKDLDIEAEPQPMYYFFHGQVPWPQMTLLIKTEIAPEMVTAAVRQAIWDVDETLPVPTAAPLAQNLSEAVAGSRFSTQLLSLFAAIALLVAAMGIYGIISYSVTCRSREIGVRIAMGARPGKMVQLILRHALILIAVGTAFGTLGAFGLTRFLRSLLYETSPTHVATFLAVVILLAFVGVVASFIPATRAAKVDPVTALRIE
jgi:predicted permease